MKLSSCALALTLASGALAQPTFTHRDRIQYDGHCFTIDGKDLVIYSGAFHYFRCPKELWRERFEKIKEAGFNTVETYVAWNWSEQKKPHGLDDYSNVDLSDFDAWLKMAEDEFHLYTIVRPGPYICSEWASGGYPNWLQSFRPAASKRALWYRSDDPVFEDWSRHWFNAVAKVVLKHQITHRPVGSRGMILWQVENEYDYSSQPDEAKRNYVKDLILCSQKDGIDVPIFSCWTSPVRYPKGDPVLSQAFDNPNEYPRWNIEDATRGVNAQHEAQPWAPKMVTEFQGGWFGGVGGQAASEQDGINDAQINALTLWTIGNGMTGLNYYMLFGGTNFGDWAAQGITTSYDYDAPLREWGGVGPKYRVVKAIGQMLQQYGPDLARSDVLPGSEGTDGEVAHITRVGASGAKYAFYWNKSRTAPGNVDGGDGKNLILPPFGANVYRYTSHPSDGAWIVNPELPPKPTNEPTDLKPFRFTQAVVTDLTPSGWRSAPDNPDTTKLGVWDSRFVAYRVDAQRGKHIWLKSQDSELVGDQAPEKTGAQGGDVWGGSGSPLNFVLFNPGWPNGGRGMELAHGIVGAKVVDKMPEQSSLTAWKMKMLDDQKDRSLAAESVDTTGWVDGVNNDLFLPHTTGVLRGTIDLTGAADSDTSLECGGVDDEGWFYVNGHRVGEVHEYNVPVSFKVGKYLHPGTNQIAIVIQNNEGEGGLTGAVSLMQPFPKSSSAKIDWTDHFKAGQSANWLLDSTWNPVVNEHPKVEGPRPLNSAHLVRSTLTFDRPNPRGIWQILLEAGGDGFLTLNGHPLGRYWEVGPQRGFYLPAPWLKDHNVLELTVVPGRFGERIKSAALLPLPAEE